MTDWQPIKTAPQDETPIDIWSPEHGRCADMFRVELAHDNVFYDPVESGFCCVRDATHWMPKPEEPS